MSRIEFGNYGIRAGAELSFTEIAGRYTSQVESEREIFLDVVQKLDISPKDVLLEIGCGPGQILIPLSFLVSEATGVDHPEVCSVLSGRLKTDNLEVLGGNFLDVNIDKLFSKILCYGVLSTLSPTEVEDFVLKALSLLRPGGRMLIGDFANVDKKARFLNSETGRVFEKDWRDRGLSSSKEDSMQLPIDTDRIVFTDEIVLGLVGLIRRNGFHCYVLPQPEALPWGNSREDLLVVRPE